MVDRHPCGVHVQQGEGQVVVDVRRDGIGWVSGLSGLAQDETGRYRNNSLRRGHRMPAASNAQSSVESYDGWVLGIIPEEGLDLYHRSTEQGLGGLLQTVPLLVDIVEERCR